MFIETKNKEELLEKLEENRNENAVIHFNCHNCDDEQVTYEDEADDQLEQFKKYGYLVLHIDCTNCGSRIGMLSPEYIQGIEIV